MTVAEMDAEVARIKSVLGPTKSAHASAAALGARAACSTGPDIAEALTNALIIHAMGQPDPRACVESVAQMLVAGVDLFLFMRKEVQS